MPRFRYQFEVDEKNGKIKVSNLPDDAKLLSVPKDNDDRKYLSYTLHRVDLTYAISFLEQALETTDNIIKQALFEAAVIRYIKCFTSSKSRRSCLDPSKTYQSVSGDPVGCHKKFYDIRNTYIAHDEEDFLSIKMGIVLQNNKMVGVVCPPKHATFSDDENIRILLSLCKHALVFVQNISDKELDRIHTKYKAVDIQTIMTFEEMKIE